MKTLILAIFAASSFFANASGTKEKAVTNITLLQNFTAQFGQVDNVVWRNARNNMTKAEFVIDDEPVCAFFDETGNFVAQTKELKIGDLPKKLKSALNEKAPGAEVLNVFEMITNDERAWFVETLANNEKKLWKGNSFGKLSRYYVQR
jgi:hypothetical protein